MQATELPTIEMNDGKTYYIDSRLKEMRNVDNPHDVITLDNCMDEEGQLLK